MIVEFYRKTKVPAPGWHVLLVVAMLCLFCVAGCGRDPDTGPPGGREGRDSAATGTLLRGGAASGAVPGAGKKAGTEADDLEQEGDEEEGDSDLD